MIRTARARPKTCCAKPTRRCTPRKHGMQLGRVRWPTMTSRALAHHRLGDGRHAGSVRRACAPSGRTASRCRLRDRRSQLDHARLSFAGVCDAGRRRAHVGSSTISPTTRRLDALYREALDDRQAPQPEDPCQPRERPQRLERRQRRHGRSRRHRRVRHRHHRRRSRLTGSSSENGRGSRASIAGRAISRASSTRPATSCTRRRGEPRSSATQRDELGAPLSRGRRRRPRRRRGLVRRSSAPCRRAPKHERSRCASSRTTDRCTRATSRPRTGSTRRSIGGIVLNAHDVSAVVAAEARLAAVADAVADVIAICDTDARIIWVSGAVRSSRSACDPDELVGLSASTSSTPTITRSRQRPTASLRRRRTPTARPIDLRLRRADGTYRWFESSGNNQTRRSVDSRPRGQPPRHHRPARVRSGAADVGGAQPEHRRGRGRRDHLGRLATASSRAFNRAAEFIFATRAPTRSALVPAVSSPQDSLQIVRSALEDGRVGQQIDTIACRASGEQFAAHVAVSEVQVGDAHYYTAVVRDISDQTRDGTGAADRGDVRRAHRASRTAAPCSTGPRTRSKTHAARTTSSAWCSSTSTGSSS